MQTELSCHHQIIKHIQTTNIIRVLQKMLLFHFVAIHANTSTSGMVYNLILISVFDVVSDIMASITVNVFQIQIGIRWIISIS